MILLDRDLPGLHGDSICRLVTDTDNPGMILMLTAAALGASVSPACNSAPTTTSPSRFPELVLRIHALARRKPAVTNRILRAAGIELDPGRCTATRDGRSLDVSAKEFAVLHALLQASPGARAPEQLLLQAWDENIDPFTRTVYVTIARLKSKLGDPPPIQSAPASATASRPAAEDGRRTWGTRLGNVSLNRPAAPPKNGVLYRGISSGR